MRNMITSYGNPKISLDTPQINRDEIIGNVNAYMTFLGELIIRLRKVYASVFLSALVLALMPEEFLRRNFTFQNYQPAIYRLLAALIDHSVRLLAKNAEVQILVSSPLTVFNACVMLALLIATGINIPFLFYEFYQFVAPALYEHEKRKLRNGMFAFGGLFVLGTLISYFFVIPVTLSVLTSISQPLLTQSDAPLTLFFSLESILSIVIWGSLSAGLLYTIPAVVYILVVLDLIDAEYLLNKRKNVDMAILIFAAIITPDPTMFSMVILSGPLILIYEVVVQMGLEVQRMRKYGSLDKYMSFDYSHSTLDVFQLETNEAIEMEA